MKKNTSPKRIFKEAVNSQTTAKKAQVSLERSFNGVRNAGLSQKKNNNLAFNQFQIGIHSLRKSELDPSSSQFQRKGALDVISVESKRIRPSAQNESASKTPGKFKKSTYLNSVKKSGNVQNLASAKQMLNHSMTSVNSNTTGQLKNQNYINTP